MTAAAGVVEIPAWAHRTRVIVLCIALLIFSNGPVFFISRRVLDRPGTWEEYFVQPTFVAAALAGAMLFVAAVANREIRSLPIAAVFASAFSAIAVWSVTWSFAPHLTGWRSWVYVGMLLTGWILGTVDARRFRSVISIFLAVALFTSLILIVFKPDIGLDETGSWRGIYLGPNSLAPIAGLGTIMSLQHLIWPTSARHRIGAALALVLCLTTLVGSQSATAIAATGIATGIAFTLIAYRTLSTTGRPRDARRVALGAIVSGVVVFGVVGPVLWQSDNFTRRRELWDLLVDRIQAHPTRGYGFFAYWDIPSLLVPRLLVRSGSAHNSFMEVFLGLGIIGLAMFVPVMVFAVVQPLRDGWRHFDGIAFMWVAVTLFAVLSNLTESFILWFSYLWILVLAGAIRRPRAVAQNAGVAQND